MRFFGSSKKPPSQDQFARMVIDAVRRAGEKGKIVYDREQFRVRIEGESGTRLFLGNAYKEYCAAARENHARLTHKFARSWFISDRPLPDEFEDAKPDLLPVVRSRAYYESAILHLDEDVPHNASWPQEPVGDHLAVTLVYDLPESMRTILNDDLETWGVTFYEALEAARENLASIPAKFIGPREGEGTYLSATGDNYDASRLLLLDVVRGFKVKGDPIAMIPNRDNLIVTGSDDVKGLEGMIALAKNALNEPRPISWLALRLVGDEWVDWMPDTSHPLYGEFRTLQVQDIDQAYGGQKAGLDRLHEKTGEDIVVASYLAVKTDRGEIFSYCVWSKGVLTLLPCADRVAFIQEGREPLFASWDCVMETLGHMMEPLDMYPSRWRVADFPTDAQFAAMGWQEAKL